VLVGVCAASEKKGVRRVDSGAGRGVDVGVGEDEGGVARALSSSSM